MSYLHTLNLSKDIKTNIFEKYMPKGASKFSTERSAFVSFCIADIYARGSEDKQDLFYHLIAPDVYEAENAKTGKYMAKLMTAAESDIESENLTNDNLNKFIDTLKNGMNRMIKEWEELYVDYGCEIRCFSGWNTYEKHCKGEDQRR